jgi:hypothetical protein
MKKSLLILLLCVSITPAINAQLDFSDLRVDLGGNYTMYKGDFQESTPGAKIRVSVPFNENMAIGLGFTYGFPIKSPSEVTYSGGSTVNSEIAYKFKTISLEYDIFLGGENEEGISPYLSGRVGLVLATYEEELKGTPPSGEEPLDMISKTTESGFTLNGAVGAQYAFGAVKVFADAGIALPANQVNNQYVANVIPAHFMFNVGVRLSLGGGGGY